MLPGERWPWLAVSALGPALPRVTPEANRASGAEEPQPRSRRLVPLGSATFDGEGDAGEARRSGDRRIYVVLPRRLQPYERYPGNQRERRGPEGPGCSPPELRDPADLDLLRLSPLRHGAVGVPPHRILPVVAGFRRFSDLFLVYLGAQARTFQERHVAVLVIEDASVF